MDDITQYGQLGIEAAPIPPLDEFSGVRVSIEKSVTLKIMQEVIKRHEDALGRIKIAQGTTDFAIITGEMTALSDLYLWLNRLTEGGVS